MKPILFFITLCFLSSCATYDSLLDLNKELIVDHFKYLAKNNPKYSYETKDSAGVLKIAVSGYEKIDCEFQFDSLGSCITSQYVYCCDSCAEKHIQEFVNERYYGWVKDGPSIYYSKRKRKTQMEVFNSNPFATVVIFTKTNWTKEEYKALIKK